MDVVVTISNVPFYGYNLTVTPYLLAGSPAACTGAFNFTPPSVSFNRTGALTRTMTVEGFKIVTGCKLSYNATYNMTEYNMTTTGYAKTIEVKKLKLFKTNKPFPYAMVDGVAHTFTTQMTHMQVNISEPPSKLTTVAFNYKCGSGASMLFFPNNFQLTNASSILFQLTIQASAFLETNCTFYMNLTGPSSTEFRKLPDTIITVGPLISVDLSVPHPTQIINYPNSQNITVRISRLPYYRVPFNLTL
eukprot:gene12008-3545_t